MRCCLSNIKNDMIVLSSMGDIVEEAMRKSVEQRENVLLDSYVIMPNHAHVIIHIGSCRDVPLARLDQPTKRDAPGGRLYKGTLGEIVNQMKAWSTKRIRQSHDNRFQWQPRFYDHIIRNDQDLEKHRLYIGINPVKWPQDEYYIERRAVGTS